MNNPRPVNNSVRKWPKRKRPSTGSIDKRPKHASADNNAVPLGPIEANNLLSMQKNHITAGIPYIGWKLFFHNEEYESSSNTVEKIHAIEGFIERHKHSFPLFSPENIRSSMEVAIDIQELYMDELFLKEWPDFQINLFDNPEHSLNCIKLAIHQNILDTLPKETLEKLFTSISTLPTVRLKLLNYQPVVSLRDLKMRYYGKLIATKGCVIRVGPAEQLAQWFVFACEKCNMQQIVRQLQGNYTMAKRCDTCGVSEFKAVLDSPHIKSIPYQIIKIQEPVTDEQEDKGQVPRTIDVELEGDLVNRCMPGDDIALTGIVKILLEENETPVEETTADDSLSLYMEVITLSNNKDKHQNNITMDNGMSIKDYLAIQEIHKSPDILSLVVHSLCPTIHGHEMVKAGLILGLLGGNMKRSARNDVHVLMVGDPGLGKSQMLRACARVAVRGVYICGNSSTSSGLTVTLTKEAGMDDFALEPGALVLSDGGCCCIDEFDKMSMQHGALLECMEQQTVSVAKSGVVCCLPARCAILSAANPTNGHYDRSKTILENLDMSQPLLSRFDLVFLLVDQRNKDLDDLLSKHVIDTRASSSVFDSVEGAVDPSESQLSGFPHSLLRTRLRSASEQQIDAIPHSILRKYISYARRYVDPVLAQEAAKVLQDFYLELRSSNGVFCNLPVCARQLEAMIRLTEARAKLELRVEATKQDALEVIEILMCTMMNPPVNIGLQNAGSSDNGKITDRKVQTFVKLLEKIVQQSKQKHFTATELKEIAADGGILVNDFIRFVSRLNDQGYLLRTEKNTFKFVGC